MPKGQTQLQKKRPKTIVSTIVASAQIAAFSGNTVVWGHGAQAVDIAERNAWYRDVFAEGSGGDESRRSRRFWEAGIRYLFLDGSVQKGSISELPGWLAAETEEIFANRSVSIRRRRSGTAARESGIDIIAR